MRCDISVIDRQMMYRISGFLFFDFSDPIPHIFDRCLGIQLGDIVSPRCLLTESGISACLSPSNAISIQVTLGWFTFEPLKGPLALFDCIFANVRKPWFIETFWYCRSFRNGFFCNVLQDGSKQRHGIISICNGRLLQTSAAYMLELVPVCPCQLPSLNPFKTRRSIVLQQDGKVVTSARVGTKFLGEVKKKRWTAKG